MPDNNNNTTDTQIDPILDALMNDKPIPQNEEGKTGENSDDKSSSNNESTSDNKKQENSQENQNTTDNKENDKAQNDPGQSADQNRNWISEASKSTGITFQSEDELKDLVNKGKSYGDLESQSTTMTQEIERLKASQEVDPFANDHIKKLNELYKGGAPLEQIRLYTEISSLDLKNLSPVELKVMALRYEHNLTKEEAENMINANYKLDEQLFDKTIVDADQIRLKIDSKKDLQFLEELQVQSASNPAEIQQKAQQEQVQKYTDQVTPIAKSIQESLTAIKGVSLNGKQGNDAIVTDLPISEESRSKIADMVTQFAVMNNVPLNAEGEKILKEFANNVAIVENFQNIIVDVASKTEERIRAEFHNPSTIQRGNDNPNDNKVTQEKQLEEWVLLNS